MLLLIDNYDSFTYNLYQYLAELGENIIVVRNDEITRKSARKINPQRIVISPGPKTPDEAGNCLEIIDEFYNKVPLLGVCLGHQCIGKYFENVIVKAPEPYHGKSSWINHNEKRLFLDIENPLLAGRYHSLVISKEYFNNKELNITSETDSKIIMSIEHKKYPVFGLQFHPESLLTNSGKKILENFLKER